MLRTTLWSSIRRRSFLALLLLPAAAAALRVWQSDAAARNDPPTAQPDRIILNLTADPSTSMAVTWRTDPSVRRAWAEIVEADDGPNFDKKARRVEAVTQAYETNLGPAHSHSVVFEGLRPASAYLYRVGDGVHWSEWCQFRTASSRPEPFSFIYLGDAQAEIRSKWARVIRQAFATAPDALFLVHAGDLINNNDRDEQWGEWHEAGGWIFRSVPSAPAPGNHEYGRGPDGQARISVNWRPQFTLPLNGPEGLEETCYYADVQGLRLIVLNSVQKREEQTRWLEAILRNRSSRWTVVTFHHPIYSGARGRDNKELRELWQPLFDKYDVDLVLQGHDHIYGRTGLMTAAGPASGSKGAVYVVSVSGAKMYDLEPKPVFVRMAEQTQLYQVIRIQGDTLRYEARTASGALYDAFELHKSAGAGKRLIERVPSTAPRLRKAA